MKNVIIALTFIVGIISISGCSDIDNALSNNNRSSLWISANSMNYQRPVVTTYASIQPTSTTTTSTISTPSPTSTPSTVSAPKSYAIIQPPSRPAKSASDSEMIKLISTRSSIFIKYDVSNNFTISYKDNWEKYCADNSNEDMYFFPPIGKSFVEFTTSNYDSSAITEEELDKMLLDKCRDNWNTFTHEDNIFDKNVWGNDEKVISHRISNLENLVTIADGAWADKWTVDIVYTIKDNKVYTFTLYHYDSLINNKGETQAPNNEYKYVYEDFRDMILNINKKDTNK